MSNINHANQNSALIKNSRGQYALVISALITLLSSCGVNTRGELGYTKKIHEKFQNTLTDRKEKNEINPDGDSRIVGKKGDTTIVYTANSYMAREGASTFSTRQHIESIAVMTENDKGTISYDGKYEINQTKDNGKLIAASPISRNELENILIPRFQDGTEKAIQ